MAMSFGTSSAEPEAGATQQNVIRTVWLTMSPRASFPQNTHFASTGSLWIREPVSSRHKCSPQIASDYGSIRRQANLDLGAFLLQGKKDRGVAIGPAAGDCFGHLLLANCGERHRRVGCPRQFERQTKILARQRQREPRLEVAAQPGGGK